MGMSFKGMMAIIMIAKEKYLKKSKKLQIGKKGKYEILTAPWMDRKGRSMIKLRRIKSRTWRRARKMNAPQRVQQLPKNNNINIPWKKKRELGEGNDRKSKNK